MCRLTRSVYHYCVSNFCIINQASIVFANNSLRLYREYPLFYMYTRCHIDIQSYLISIYICTLRNAIFMFIFGFYIFGLVYIGQIMYIFYLIFLLQLLVHIVTKYLAQIYNKMNTEYLC